MAHKNKAKNTDRRSFTSGYCPSFYREEKSDLQKEIEALDRRVSERVIGPEIYDGPKTERYGS